MSPDVTPADLDRFIEEHRGELIGFAGELVAAPSPSPPGDERAVVDVLETRLRRLGIEEVRVAAPEPERPSLIATIPGSGDGPTLMLCGHTDTKPPGDLDAWETRPYEPSVVDGHLAGLGAADMKGAVAAMVYAAASLRNAKLRGTLQLVFPADEEAGGRHGAGWLAEEGLLRADACVIGEPCGVTRDWEAIRLVSRGAAIFTIRVHGTQMHSGLSDRLPSRNASVALARLMVRIADAGTGFLTFEPHPLVPLGPTVNVGLKVSSGLGYGILPGEGEFLSDIRALPGMTRESIEHDLATLLDQAKREQDGLDLELALEAWTPPCEISSDHALVAHLVEGARAVLGRSVPLDSFPGGTDAPYFQLAAGIPTVPAFGPGLLTAAHAPNESVSVEAIVQAAKIYARTAHLYLDG